MKARVILENGISKNIFPRKSRKFFNETKPNQILKQSIL